MLMSKFVLKFAPLCLLVSILAACGEEAKVERKPDHSLFAQTWNNRAEKILGGEKYMASPDGRDASVELVNLAKAFSREWTPEQKRELEALRKEALTTFHLYAEYARENYRREPPSLNDKMSDQELALALNEWLGVKSGDRTPDYPTSETVRRMIFMNDFCAYFLNNRKAIHRRGIDTAINSCEELPLGPSYPWLDSLTGKNSTKRY